MPVMQITLRQLQIFRAIALTGSTTAAALSVPLSQSATSTALTELERGLQARLFDRVGKRLLLNDSGRALLPLALGVLDGARNIESAFLSGEGGPRVDLHLFASTTIGNYVLPKLLSSFRASVPAARLDVRIGNTLEVINAVCEFSTDLGLIEGPCHVPDVIIKPWFEDELVIVAAPMHPLAKAAAGQQTYHRATTPGALAPARARVRYPRGSRNRLPSSSAEHTADDDSWEFRINQEFRGRRPGGDLPVAIRRARLAGRQSTDCAGNPPATAYPRICINSPPQ